MISLMHWSKYSRCWPQRRESCAADEEPLANDRGPWPQEHFPWDDFIGEFRLS